MNPIVEFKSTICRSDEKSQTLFDGPTGKTWIIKDNVLNFHSDVSGATATIEFSSDRESELLPLCSMEALFGGNPDLKTIFVKNPPATLLPYFPMLEARLEVRREEFFQLPLLWHGHSSLNIPLERWTVTKDVAHPERPRVYTGQMLYKRYVPQIDKTISFRVVDPEKDLDIFHEWQNQDRVANFWELNKSKAELKDYLLKGLQDPHQFPSIVEFDGVAIGYFEFYWVKEDRLGPYYDSDPYDRGFHFLIGDASYLGFRNTDAILKSVTHFIFLDEPRTRKIMAEPRSDNVAVLKYVETFKAWSKLKEFDFPHKRAALLQCRREDFFKGNFL